MKAKNTIKESRTDWNRLEELPDSKIDVSDISKLDQAFFQHAKLRMPKRKKSVSLRLDPDVLDWFKHQGRGGIKLASMQSSEPTSKPISTNPDSAGRDGGTGLPVVQGNFRDDCRLWLGHFVRWPACLYRGHPACLVRDTYYSAYERWIESRQKGAFRGIAP